MIGMGFLAHSGSFGPLAGSIIRLGSLVLAHSSAHLLGQLKALAQG